MSIEASIAALTVAMNENTEVQRALLAKVDGADNSGSGDTSTAGGERERGKPAPGSGRTRRTKEEIAEDDAAAAAESGSGTTTATTTTTTKTDGVSFDDLKAALGGWLGEFAKAEDKTNPDGTHPEVTARRDALKKVLVKITGNDDAKLPMLAEDPASITRLHDWLEKTAKNADKGHGIGRLAADPAPAGDDADGDDDLGV